ncbi:amidohydrolase family protein [Planctomycetota bacterium]
MRAEPHAPDLTALKPFDSCVTLGTVVHSKTPEYVTAENILEMMDRYRIAEALVHQHHARLIYPREKSNRLLLEEIRGIPRLHPQWVLEPAERRGKETSAAIVDEMLAAGVRSARLPMKTAPPMLWLWDDLLSALEEHRVPCFIDLGMERPRGGPEDSDVNGIREIALAHPELPLVLSCMMGGLGIHYAVLPLIRQTKNVYIDIAGLVRYWRDTARDAGPERVLFGTGAPFTEPGILISNVQYALDLDENAKRLIYGDNLRRLLENVR